MEVFEFLKCVSMTFKDLEAKMPLLGSEISICLHMRFVCGRQGKISVSCHL